MQAQLIPVGDGDPITLKRDMTLVGRKSDLCDLVVDKNSISKIHCLIVKTDGLLFIRDLGSTNGTKVNGQRVTRGALLPGDELAFASVKFRVNLGPGDSEHARPEQTEMLTSLSGVRAEELEIVPDASSGSSDVRLVPGDSEY